jgi:uncharacterized membrane-anchored protein
VQFQKKTYRNDFKYIWNGAQLTNLQYDQDEYSHVPREYTLEEFPWDYWNYCIDHNRIRWPSEHIANQVKKNVTLKKDYTEKNYDIHHTSMKYCCPWASYFIVNGRNKYYVHPSADHEINVEINVEELKNSITFNNFHLDVVSMDNYNVMCIVFHNV